MSIQIRTPTETLMSALEECEDANDVLIIIRHKDAVSWHTTCDSRIDKLGMLEFVSTCVRASIIKEESTD